MLLVLGFASVARASLRDYRLASTDFPPATCHWISGTYAIGPRPDLFYDYTKYAGVLPPLVHKDLESFECNGQKGTLYYYEYASDHDRDNAELFAKPVLSQDNPKLQIKDWPNGFVVVSFKDPPAVLLEILDKKLAAAPPPPAVASAPPSPSVSPDNVPDLPPPTPKDVVESQPHAYQPQARPLTPTAASLQQMAVTKPSAPMSADEGASALKLSPQAPPPQPRPAPIPKKSVPPPLPPSIKETRKPAPPPPPPAAIPAPPPAPAKLPLAASGAPTPELDSSVLASFVSKIGCENIGSQSEIRFVCNALKEFTTALRIDDAANADLFRIGQAFTIDSYGRFVGLHYEIIKGTPDPGTVGFVAYESTGGQDDFELANLREARQSNKPLPRNGVLAKILALAARKRLAIHTTASGRSLVLLPGGQRTVYLRKSAEHWILVAPDGQTPDDQTRRSLVVAVMY